MTTWEDMIHCRDSSAYCSAVGYILNANLYVKDTSHLNLHLVGWILFCKTYIHCTLLVNYPTIIMFIFKIPHPLAIWVQSFLQKDGVCIWIKLLFSMPQKDKGVLMAKTPWYEPTSLKRVLKIFFPYLLSLVLNLWLCSNDHVVT